MSRTTLPSVRRGLTAAAVALIATLGLSACVAGEDAPKQTASSGAAWSATTLNIDYATYNPLSLIIKQQGWLEKKLGPSVTVNWVKSTGSNTANAALKSGAIDVGSTAGSAALLAASNGSPIKVIDVFSQPDWAAILVPTKSPITSVAELKGKSIAVTKGTDPYFFLIQSLTKAGLSINDVTVTNLQHADGKSAIEAGSVDAWSGLDPLLTTSVANGATRILYDNIDYNSYGVLDATTSFLQKSPDLAQVVVNAYEKARAWAKSHPSGEADAISSAAGITPAIAEKVVTRTNLTISPVPGDKLNSVLKVIGPVLVKDGGVTGQSAVDSALKGLFEPKYAKKADPGAL